MSLETELKIWKNICERYRILGSQIRIFLYTSLKASGNPDTGVPPCSACEAYSDFLCKNESGEKCPVGKIWGDCIHDNSRWMEIHYAGKELLLLLEDAFNSAIEQENILIDKIKEEKVCQREN